jgi:hypothetical protein
MVTWYERKEKTMVQLTQESFDNLMKMVEDGHEVHITYEPERVEVEVMPWKPFEYRCPYQMAQKEEE